MVVQGALAHVGDTVSSEQFLRFLAQRVPKGEYFIVEPPPGIIMTAAMDWRIVLPDSKSMQQMIAALWEGYESFILPLHCEDATACAAMLIQIKNHKGEFDQFSLGRDITLQELFVQRMQETARTLSPRNAQDAFSQEIRQTCDSGFWEQLDCA